MNGSLNGLWTMLAIQVIFVLAFVVSRWAWRKWTAYRDSTAKEIKSLKERINKLK